MGDVVLRGSLLRRGAFSGKMARTTTVEANVVGGSPSSQGCW
jgi:hypothetical protein